MGSMIRQVVCMPWRGGDPEREKAYREVRQRWSLIHLPVYTGDVDGRFNRAAARNQAAANADLWDVAVIADADCLVDGPVVRQALDLAYSQRVLVFPHNQYVRLGRHGHVVAESHGSSTNGGVVAISRASWEKIGGYDQRLSGWGFEDAAFWMAAETLLGPSIHLRGTLTELHHAKVRDSRPEDRALFERYAAANGDPEAMRRLVTEPGRQ